jgi:Domain of unknown function (DUF4160)
LPRISEFFGIAIYMYWFDQQKHHNSHFHARFAGEEAVFDLMGNCLEGNLGPRATRLVVEWCGERQAELQQAWDAASAGRDIPWVAPLR